MRVLATIFIRLIKALVVPLVFSTVVVGIAGSGEELGATTKGIAAVPRASLVILSATLTTFGLPLEGVALILAVDAVMDMARTGTNMLSHCLATVVLSRWERPAATS